MTFADALRLALRNLRQAKLRTSLTSMGVAIGVASLAGMVSLGVGLQDQVVGSLMRSGLFDSITVVSVPQRQLGFAARAGGVGRGPFGRGGRGLGRGNPNGDAPPRTLDDDALKALAAVPEVSHVFPNLRIPMQATLDQEPEFVPASGVANFSDGKGAFQTYAAGHFFTSDTADECILTTELMKRLTTKDAAAIVGHPLVVSYAAGANALSPGLGVAGQIQRVEARLTIVGIIERDQNPMGGALGAASGLMIPLGKARELSGSSQTYQNVTVNVARASAVGDVEDKIKAMGFQAFSVNDALQGAKRAFILLDIFLSLIGSIALAVSSLGIINTMVMSILERTREIGIMKAIGGSDGDIRRIFLIEASSIGLLGGVAGIAIGWIVGRAINAVANIYISSQGGPTGNFFSLPFWLVGGAIGFSVVISLLAGSYPAGRAARLDPIQALRHD